MPNTKFLLQNMSHFIALGFGSGLSKKAPGTLGTLVALPFFLLINETNIIFQVLFVTVSFFIGLWASNITSESLKLKDPSCIVIDEVAAFLLLLILINPNLYQAIYAFILFRLFDIWKPYPISWLEEKYSGGFGIMIDDIGAALMAFIIYTITNYAF
ncbi:MAG: phosphatidylglycerophosphatase A [Methylophilales bacterium]|nr:phosphatidylglycerophosphatase A [Pseudomonadota bacterium]NQW34573.1 phosphatidylglycerophosphatase A [Methylophilales bacterium]HCK03194.1 phosphatidylglycerophosphatase A [Methylophilaceae bacterium]